MGKRRKDLDSPVNTPPCLPSLLTHSQLIVKKRVISPQGLKETIPKLCSWPRVSRVGLGEGCWLERSFKIT